MMTMEIIKNKQKVINAPLHGIIVKYCPNVVLVICEEQYEEMAIILAATANIVAQ